MKDMALAILLAFVAVAIFCTVDKRAYDRGHRDGVCRVLRMLPEDGSPERASALDKLCHSSKVVPA